MNALKKLLAMLLCIAMFSVVFPTGAFAADPNPYGQTVGNAEFSVSTSFCATGETTKIFVDIKENSQMSAGLFTLTYDTSMLRALNIETGLVLKNGTTSKNITNSGTVKVAYADVNPTYDEGRLFEVEFEAIGDVPQGEEFVEIPVTLTVSDLRNYEDYKIASTVTNGKITLINTPYGDVNLSGDVTATDALITLYANSQLIELEENQSKVADVNGDTKISAADALLILQYSAGAVSNYPIFTMEAPTGLVVSAKNETSIDLLWDVSKYVIGYNVYMDGNKINDEIITENNYTVDGLTQDTRYNFEITAINALKESEKSRLLEVSTDKAERNVTFRDYDGTILDTQIVLSGQAAVLPANPTRKGYTFTSWDGDTEHIVTDAVFTAQYEINTYTVTFDYQYDNQAASDSAVYLTSVSDPALISRDQFTLEGWYQDKNYVKKWNFDTDVIEDNMTLYAKWNPLPYQVTWNNGTGYTISVRRTSSPYAGSSIGALSNNDTVYYGDVLSITYTPNTGYSLSSSGKTAITVSDNVTSADIYASATLNSYTYNIVYKSSNGTSLGTTTATYEYGTSHTISAPAKSGYKTPESQTVMWDSTSAKTITFTYAPSSVSTSQYIKSGVWWYYDGANRITYAARIEYRNRTANSVQIRVEWTNKIVKNYYYGYAQYFNASANGASTGTVTIASSSLWSSSSSSDRTNTVYSGWITVPVNTTAQTTVNISGSYWDQFGSNAWSGTFTVPAY